MIIDVLTWDITGNYSGSWDVEGGGSAALNSGQTIVVKLDDSTGTLSAWQNGTNKLLNGPNLFFGYGGSATLRTLAPFYQYCEGTTLRQVGTSNGFPYATLSANYNNSECQVAPTCDLEISNDYVITPATGPSASDGSIVGSATSSNGVIKFSLTANFEYGDPFPLEPLDPISTWVNFNTSTEPMTWTTGSNPTLVITAPTVNSPAKSDWIGPAYGSNPLIEGRTYKYAFQFTAYSDVTDYLFIRVVVGDVFFNVLLNKSVAGYATPEGTVINGTWQFVAPAEVGGSPLRVGVYAEFAVGATSDGSVVINSFEDISGSPDAPGVVKELNFDNLLPGTYTVYAKDAAGCQDSLTFEIPVTTSYGVRYRLEYSDMLVDSSQPVRIDIEMRDYSGPIEEICGGQQPTIVRYEGDRDDPNMALVASNLTLEMMVQTSEEFADFYLCDDRKYRLKMYIGDSLDLYWVGYHIPEFGTEPYLYPPYYFTITATDGLAELKQLEFLDANENRFRGDMSAMKIISEILKKTGLELPIRSGINVWDSGMTEDEDPLTQAYIDSRIYYNKEKTGVKCDVVLRSIADPFRGQIFQSMGVWWIIRLSDAVGTFPYREFTFDGVLDDEGTFNPIVELDFPTAAGPKVMFAEKTQLLSFVRNYGYFSITHNLAKDGNLIDTGLFEAEDIIELASGNKTFQDWNVLLGQPGVKYGYERVTNGDSQGAFYFDFTTSAGNQVDTVLYSAPIPLNSTAGRIGFKFQYFVTPLYTVPYIRIAWTLRFHNPSDDSYRWLTYSTNGSITYSFTESKNDLYVSEFDKWINFEILTDTLTFLNADYVEIGFYVHDHRGRDFDDIVDMKAFDPSTLSNPGGTKHMVSEDFGETRIYEIEYSLDAESLPEVVRPDSYNAGDGDHRWLWRIDKIIPLGASQGLVSRVKFDNVAVAFYPLVLQPTTQIIDPPETLSYSKETDQFVKSDFSKTVLLGDMIRFDADQTRNEKNLYRGYFRLSDGTPTLNWHRLGVDESKRILQILLEDYIAQFSLPTRRLSGMKITENVILHFVNCLRDNVDGARYRPMTFEFDVKNASYTPDMAGVAVGEGGEPPVEFNAFSNAFSNAFNAGS